MEINNLVLHLTERCNMRCRYCFMTRGEENMSKGTAEKSVDFLLQNCGQYARVTFFGGEPLLEFELIQHVTEYIKNKSNRPVMLDIVTNGTLLDGKFFEYADANSIHISISYDGLLNGSNRIGEDGKPVPDISGYKDEIEKFGITSASVIDTDNIGIWHENVLHLRELGFRSMDFFINYSSQWQAEHIGIMRREYFKIADSYVKWIGEGNKVRMTKIDDMVRAYSGKFGLSRTRVRRDLVYSIAANGDVYPYASAVGNKKLCLGNVVSGMNGDLLERVNSLGYVRGCGECPINDVCVAAKGNIITDAIEPFAYPIACNGYKIGFDVADYVLNKLLGNTENGINPSPHPGQNSP